MASRQSCWDNLDDPGGENEEEESRSESRGGGFLSSTTRSRNGNRVGIVHSIPLRHSLLFFSV